MKLIRKQPNLVLKKNAFPFQQEAIDLIKDKEYFAIFHEQGLGKTKIAIDLIYHWINSDIIDSVIVVTKKSLISNWSEELEFHGNLNPIILSNNKITNYQKLSSPGFLYVCNYELLRNDLPRFMSFCKMRKVGIILDESTQIKTPSSKTSKALHELSTLCTRKIIMTGTPISNRPYDIWSQIYFLDSGQRLGSTFEDFKDSYDLGNDLNNNLGGQIIFKNNLKILNDKLKDCSLRETKETAGIQLPGKKFIAHEVSMDAKQYILYKKIQEELSAEVLKDGKIITEDVEVILKRLIRLVQISSNPKLVDENYTQTPPKLLACQKIIESALLDNSKVIIWTNFVQNVDEITNFFANEGAVGISGKFDINQRNSSIKSFRKDPQTKILVATPGVAKEGLTLVEANHAIFFDRNFSLENYLQAQDRIYRISQERDCFIYKLLSINSIDYWVDALLDAKEIAARYGQGDINEEEYDERMNFEFSEILSDILQT
jgi:SNF2 family DNA or RNA helicase